MDYTEYNKLNEEAKPYFLKAYGFTDEEIPGAMALLAKGLQVTAQPTAAAAATGFNEHPDKASVEKVKGREGAETVPASKYNKSDAAMLDDEEREDDDEDGDGIPDDEEYPPKGAMKAKKSQTPDFGTEDFADDWMDTLAKSAGPQVAPQFDASVVLQSLRDTIADMYGELAFGLQEMRKSLDTVDARTKNISKRQTVSNNKLVDHITKTIGEIPGQIETLQKSMAAVAESPVAPVSTGVVHRIESHNGDASKGVYVRTGNFDADHAKISASLEKSLQMTTGPDEVEIQNVMIKMPRVKNYDELDWLTASVKPEYLSR